MEPGVQQRPLPPVAPPQQQQQQQQLVQQQQRQLQPPSRRRPPANRVSGAGVGGPATGGRSSSPESDYGGCGGGAAGQQTTGGPMMMFGKPPPPPRLASPAYASVHRARLPSPGLALQREQYHKRMMFQQQQQQQQQKQQQQQQQQQQHQQQQQQQLYGYHQIAAHQHQTPPPPNYSYPASRMPMPVQIPQPHQLPSARPVPPQRAQLPIPATASFSTFGQQQQLLPLPPPPLQPPSSPQRQAPASHLPQYQHPHRFQPQLRAALPLPPPPQAPPPGVPATQHTPLPPVRAPPFGAPMPPQQHYQKQQQQQQYPAYPTTVNQPQLQPRPQLQQPQYPPQQQPANQHQHHHHSSNTAANVAAVVNQPTNAVSSAHNQPAGSGPPPAAAAHFQNISKTATNLLNEIYEKHLLAQTRFEADGGGGGGQTGATTVANDANAAAAVSAACVGDFNFHSLSQQQQRQLLMRQQRWLQTTSASNNHGANGTVVANVAGHQATANIAAGAGGGGGGGIEMMIKNNDRQRVPRKISDAATLKIQRSLNERQMALAAAAAAVAAAAGCAANQGERAAGSGGGEDQQQTVQPQQLHWLQRSVNPNVYCDIAAVNQQPDSIIGHTGLADGSGQINARSEPLGGNGYTAVVADSSHGLITPMNPTATSPAAVADHSAATTPQFGHHHYHQMQQQQQQHQQQQPSTINGGSKINIMLETAQAMAAAAYFARAAQRMSNSNAVAGSRVPEMSSSERGGFCGALQRAPPPMPAGLARRLANRDNFGVGKVKVMLRISDNAPATTTTTETTATSSPLPHFMSADKKKRQVTLTDPATLQPASATQERGPMVAAPKMFAFDGLFTGDDTQADVCSSALSEVIPVVLEGSDACLMTLGYPTAGQSRTMFGSVQSANGGDLGAIPCAISWLYKGIGERKQTTGSRFSVRVSAIGVSATKSTGSKDLLAAHKTESDESPSSYLRDDYLGGPTELQAPTAERAALYLDAALAERTGATTSGLDPTLIFTLHVYQYSLERRGQTGGGGSRGGFDRDAGVVKGGRSRLHLIDLGGCANRSGGLPLSGIGNVLLAILSGQRHPPNRDHALTPLLKDCLAPLSCHVSVLAHVSHSQTHTDALTTIQLASRIHRMRRRKHRYPLPSDKQLGVSNTGNQSGSSEGPDPSSSDLSADTVIYMGPADDATDGEHPPVYLPSMFSGDQRCSMNKALKGSTAAAEKPSKLPQRRAATTGGQHKPQSPVPVHRSDSMKRPSNTQSPQKTLEQIALAAAAAGVHYPYISPVVQAQVQAAAAAAAAAAHAQAQCGTPAKALSAAQPYRHVASNVPTPKGSPMRRAVAAAAAAAANAGGAGLGSGSAQGSPKRQPTGEEQWVDGPRLSKTKVAEARHLLREINHVKQKEQWIDGPKIQGSPAKSMPAKLPASAPLVVGSLPGSNTQSPGYGYMDSHKKTMIRQWVENQTSQIFQPGGALSAAASGVVDQQLQSQLQSMQQQVHQQQQQQPLYSSPSRKPFKSGQFPSVDLEDQHSIASSSHHTGELLLAQHNQQQQQPHQHQRLGMHPMQLQASAGAQTMPAADQLSVASSASLHRQSVAAAGNAVDEEDQDSGPSEVPPALPLIEPLSSREISHDSIHRLCSRHVSRESLSQLHIQTKDCGLQVTEDDIVRAMGDHPLSALSHGNMSAVSSFHHSARDAVSECLNGDRTKNQFDQLARLRELYTSQLAMAEVVPVPYRLTDACSVFSEPAYRFIAGNGSVCSEPAYRVPSPRCSECRQSIGLVSRTPSQISLPSLDGIVAIADMDQYASLRHPDGASDPNLQLAGKLDGEGTDPMEDGGAGLTATGTGAGGGGGSGAGSRFGVSDAHTGSGDEADPMYAGSGKMGGCSSNMSGGGAASSLADLPMSPNAHHQYQQQQHRQHGHYHHGHQRRSSAAQPHTTQPKRKLSDSSGASHSLLLHGGSDHQHSTHLGAMGGAGAEGGGTGAQMEAAYDSGHDSSTTPRTSKHSGISRRAESGYHSVATVRDSDESSFGSAAYRGGGGGIGIVGDVGHGGGGGGGGGHGGGRSGSAAQRITAKKQRSSSRQDRSLCNWLRNPFTCTYPDTEGEISDF